MVINFWINPTDYRYRTVYMQESVFMQTGILDYKGRDVFPVTN